MSDEARGAIATVVLAAGAGTRFGATKQLAEVEGRAMLARVLDAVDGLGESQTVVLGADAEAVRELVPEDRWRVVLAPGWEVGIGASLRAGLAAASEAEAALVVLGDLPWLRREAVERVLAAAAASPRAEAVRAHEGPLPGHPVLLRGALLEAARAAPDRGLAGVLSRARIVKVDCSGLGVARDVDVASDLASAPGSSR